jgi:anti-anti-sigma factor
MAEEERRAFHNKIFFCDIIGYSKLPTVEQYRAQSSLSQILRASLGRLGADCVALPTGDGVILNFVTGDPHVHLEVALDALKGLHEDGAKLGLRIGLNSHVDALVRDINGNRNVVGDGINMAQRIMDLGRHGQILMHDRVKSDLQNHPDYFDRVERIGEFTVKHGQRLPIAQFIDPDVDFVSSERLAPQPGQAAPTLGLSDILRSRVKAEVLSLQIDRQGLQFLPDISDYIEEFLEESDEFRQLRYSVAWIVTEMMENALRHGQLPDGGQILLKLNKTARGLIVSVTQPDVSGFAFDAVLNDPKHHDSFLQILARAGLKLQHWREGGRLEIMVETPIAPKFGPLADFADSPLASHTAAPAAADPARLAGLIAEWTQAGVEIYRPEDKNIDDATNGAFLQGLRTSVDRTHPKNCVVIDLSHVEHMSSVGLRALMNGLRHAKGRDVVLYLWRPTPRLREILAISRYDKLFQIVDDADPQSVVLNTAKAARG